MNMSPKLRPLRLPLLVEERRKREEAQSEASGDGTYRAYSLDSSSSDVPSPVTPTFSTRGHLRCSSSTSSFELAPPTNSESPASPVQSATLSSKRVLDDVQEEPHELEDFDNDDALSDQFDLCDCLNNEPCIREDSELMVESPPDFYSGEQDIEYDLGCLSDSDFQAESRSRKRSISFTSLSQRLGSRLASLSRRRGSRQRSTPSSPTPDLYDLDAQRNVSRVVSRAASRADSSRSSSRSPSGRYLPGYITEDAMPPTPALSAYQSTESIALQESVDDLRMVNDICASIQRERAMATTPLLPPLMNVTHSRSSALPSPLESPTIVSPLSTDWQSPTLVSPPLSTKPSISSFRGLTSPVDIPSIPEPDAWSDRLGHANFTILPQPYEPEVVDEKAVHQFHLNWDSARVNYTKHLARTGEHYGVNSKTYVLTEAKWAEIDRTWRRLHDAIAEIVIASGVAAHCTQCEETILTIMPNLNAEGKFPERGDEDIVGPMVRQASMTADGIDRKRPSLWRRVTGPLRK